MKKFDLRKMIAENKATFFASLNEGEAAYEYEKGKEAGEEIEKDKLKEESNKQKLIDAGYSESDAEDFADEFEQGGVKVPQKVKDILSGKSSSKMKKSELKAKIKEMIVAEMDGPAVEDEEYDFLKEMENMLEADEEADAEEAPAEEPTGDEAVDTTVDVTTDEVDPNVKAVQDALTQAQAAAQQLGDKKLMDQIGNTITFFTRSHVVEKPGAVSENLNEEEGTPSDGMHQVILSYIRPDFRDTYPKSYDKYWLFLRANSKPVFGPNNPKIFMKFLKDLIKNKVVTLDALNSFAEEYNDGRGGLEGLAYYLYKQGSPELLKKIDNLSTQSENLNESMFPILKKILK